MHRLCLICLLIPCSWLFSASSLLAWSPEIDASLTFEAGESSGLPVGWGGGPEGTIFYESEVVHGGEGAARVERQVDSAGQFSSLTRAIEVDFAGQRIEMRGFLKTRGVEGSAGLWIRVDGPEGMIKIENMAGRRLTGDNEWAEHSVSLPLDRRATSVYFGVLMAGPGQTWVDELRFFVDGEPIAKAPERVREKTILETDLEFSSGSKIEIESLDGETVADLETLARVWGFVKYHHPRIAAGDKHWDFELFRILPEILAAKDAASRDEVLVRWLGTLEPPADCDPCAEAPKDPYFSPRLDWIDGLSLELADRLRSIHQKRARGIERFFVTATPMVLNPDFSGELGYGHLVSPDVGYRILALFRLWNVIEYYFPYRDVIEKPWPEVLRDFIPRMVAARTAEDYQLELLQLIAEIGDGHSNLWSADRLRPPRGDCRVPAAIRIIEGQAMVVELADGVETTLRVGDVVRSLGGRPVTELFRDWKPFYPASNPESARAGMGRNLLRGTCGSFAVEVDRGGEVLKLEAERVKTRPIRHRHDRSGETFQRLSDEIAYLKLSSVRIQDVGSYLEAAEGSRGLVIDIRNYPSEFVVFALGQHLVDESTPFVSFTVADYDNPGAFIWSGPLSLQPAPLHYGGGLAILVDEMSISQSEYTAMAFRAAPKATVIGSTTAGADGNFSAIPLPGGLRTGISGIGVFYPDKSPTQRIGIVPDIRAEPTVEGWREGRDEPLEAAIRHLLGPDADEAEVRRLAARPGVDGKSGKSGKR